METIELATKILASTGTFGAALLTLISVLIASWRMSMRLDAISRRIDEQHSETQMLRKILAFLVATHSARHPEDAAKLNALLFDGKAQEHKE